MIGTAHGAVLEGIEATPVLVEADVSNGIPQFHIVGLPDSAVSESKLRIRSAIRNAGLQFPSRRITVNLSPASMRKRGAGLDLAIAVAILRASGQVPPEPASAALGGESFNGMGFCAELGLGGQLVPVAGVVNLALALRKAGFGQIIVSADQASSCVGLPNVAWYGFEQLQAVVEMLTQPVSSAAPLQLPPPFTVDTNAATGDFSEVQGLTDVKRALTIAAAGRHHVLLVGPPGCGKTMIAERFFSILPPLGDEEALDVYAIHQAAGLNTPATRVPPLRAPHHSVTAAGLIGGGNPLAPGEVTLAHHGVLLLDEMPEFSRHVLDALREPIVNGEVRLARGGKTTILPAHFQLLATMNPCLCGRRGFGECRCTDAEVLRYWSRISGPLLDRIEMLIYVQPISWKSAYEEETSAVIQQRVLQGRQRIASAPFAEDALQVLQHSARTLKLSQRAAAAVHRVADTIRALAGAQNVQRDHVFEALALRAPAMTTSPRRPN
ncbi:YifB family Mg chelatase-like AAA ATPase [Alicyclobacillus cycloheptanicus]|uniref:Magnesium chelatase family protein n=1 Tax=Alicyclobacillus cycloheptanicus TaxID=1457 RepID=A0ABT9XJT8_9BACL|nr:YifB family Mg chelatase-like AAA ATPase [Alicyclobacillus cycloheptanicus]MDQ0190574.1 magnesium chelatase family protein [Alicyclobacillus cycloheptanicus]WDM01414.1 YifB family Mg chelatase-like AAA ATPase [Alicyclobacillus cycloheptanicus]